MTDPNDPAFNDESYMSSGEHVHDKGYKNLTKREYFAAMAMTGLLSSGIRRRKFMFEICGSACRMADALINELNKEKP